MHKKNMHKAVVAVAITLAFISPGSSAFANVLNKDENIDNTPVLPISLDNQASIQALDKATSSIDDNSIDNKNSIKIQSGKSDNIDWWPMVRHDLGNTGYSKGTAPNTNNVLWKYTTGGNVRPSPAIVNGKVYFGSNDKNLYCLDETDGTLIWKYTTGDRVRSSPSVVNGKVYFGSDDYNIYCLNAQNGSFIWSYPTSGEIFERSPAVSDGKVYIASMDGTYDGNLYCLDATNGSKIWEYFITNGVQGDPAVVDGKVYFGGGSNGYYIYCLDAANGSLIWQSSDGIGSSGTLAVVDDKVYTIDYQDKRYGFVYCLDATDGSVIWGSAVDGLLIIGPAVANGKVYVSAYDNYGTDNNKVYCLDATDGSLIWISAIVGDEIRSAPSVADGKVYFSSYDQNVYCLDESDGTLIWKYTTGYKIYASPSIANGKMFIGSLDDNLYCFGLFQGHDVGIARGGEAPFCTSIDSPVTGSFDVITPKVRVQNGGIYNEMNVPVNIQIARVSDGNIEYDETVTVDIDFEETKIAIFPDWTPEDMGASDSMQYRLTVYTQMAGDENPANDYETNMIGLYPDDVDWWPMFHHDLSNSGNSTGLGPETNNVLWKQYVDLIWSSFAVVDGKVYFGAYDYKIYCVDAYDGSFIWSYYTGWHIQASPIVADGRVFFGSEDYRFYCLDAQNGSLIWKYAVGACIWSSAAVVDGRVYFGCTYPDGNVYCLDAQDGSLIWKHTLADNYNTGYSSPAVVDGKVYIGTVNYRRGQILCLDAINGLLIWRYDTGEIISSPAVVNGKVYVGSEDRNFYCLDAANGSLIWKYYTSTKIWSSPAVADDKVYFGAWNGNVYCLDAMNGSLIWKYFTGHAILRSSPAVADGKVYITNSLGLPPPGLGDQQKEGDQDPFQLYCLDATNGSFIWKYYIWGAGLDSPSIADGKVYIGALDGFIYCFGPPSPNFPPDIPRIPYPRDGTLDVDVDAVLSWVGGDPNPSDTVTYDVFFGTTSPPPKVVSNQSGACYDPGTMDGDTSYFWRIVSWDDSGVSTAGPIWCFTTEIEPEPDLDCDGSLSWIKVAPGSTVIGSFTVSNIGDLGSELNWEIESYPNWSGSTWTFTPSSGNDLTPEYGPFTVEVEVVAPDEPNTEFNGEVKIINSDDPTDNCTISAKLVTPMRQNSFVLQFLERLIQRFPILERILSYFFRVIEVRNC